MHRAVAALAAAAALLTAPPARAEDAQAEEGADERAILLDLGWEAGPTYELGYHSPIPETFDPLDLSRDVRLRGRLGGSLFLDLGYLGGTALDDGWEKRVRRARFFTSGKLARWATTEFKVEFAVEDYEVYLNDFYVRWRPSRFAERVRLGFFQPPVSLESIAGSADKSLMELPLPVAAFAPGYQPGIEVAGSFASPDLGWTLALSSRGQEQESADASEERGRVTGRLVWRPWHDEGAPAPTLLHLGASVSYSGGGDIQYRARPESFLAPYLADTEEIRGEATLVALEGAWRRGPLSLQGEWFQSFVHPDGASDLAFGGGYLQGSWVLTGEFRPYDRELSVFGRVAAASELAPWDGRWGAFEVAARLSWLDLADGSVRGGRMAGASVGLVWTWNRWVRVLAGYVYTQTSGAAARNGSAHVVQSRLELRI